MRKIAVIGGGPAGAVAAFEFKKRFPQDEVTIYEASDSILKRILVSGNGRSNFFNQALLSEDAAKNYDDQNGFKRLVSTDDAGSFLSFLNSDCRFSYFADSEGRLYPFSNTASSLRDSLLNALMKTGVIILNNTPITSIDPDKKIIRSGLKNFVYDVLFLGMGGVAFDRQISKVTSLLTDLRLDIKPFSPALCPLQTEETIPASMVGSRLKGTLVFYKDGVQTYVEQGEMLFKKDGLSGICVFDASLFIDPKGGDYTIRFNPLSHDGYNVSLDRERRNISDLAGIFPNSFIKAFIDKGYKSVGNQDVLNMLSFHVKSKYAFKDSQISSGGVLLNQINDNLSLISYPDIFIGGELLNLHGICGGFNLGLAFMSGIKAGLSLK